MCPEVERRLAERKRRKRSPSIYIPSKGITRRDLLKGAGAGSLLFTHPLFPTSHVLQNFGGAT